MPKNARDPGSKAFCGAVTAYLETQYKHFGGRVEISLDEVKKQIHVKWSHDPSEPDASDVVVDHLNRGDYKAAVPLLEILKLHEPHNAQHAYNLGMALSDLGQLDWAEKELRLALKLDPSCVNALVALGVAMARKGDFHQAIEFLREAVKREPENPWARRNLGGCLLKSGNPTEAEPHLRRSAELLPSDQAAWFGLGQVLEALGKNTEADELYIRVIQLGTLTPVAEAAKEARSRLAHSTFRSAGGGAPRIDAVMYCLGALEKFENMTPAKIQQIGMEIAILGMKGLDTGDPTQKYTLKSLPGKFSGLHLVCIQHVAFKVFAPELDIGFDLKQEYAQALVMHENKQL